MKIGIMIKDLNSLANWEVRIIQGIFDNPSLELSLLIQDGRAQPPGSMFRKLFTMLTSHNPFGRLLLTSQVKIESYLFGGYTATDNKAIINKLLLLDTIKLSPTKNGYLDVFTEGDSVLIEEYELDVILRHQFNIIQGPVLTAAKYGIWSFHHADNSINRGGPAGFWEIILKQATTGVTLQQLTAELDGGLIIDKANFNTKNSFFKNKTSLLENSVSMLFRSLERLERGCYNTSKSMVYCEPLFRTPNGFQVVKYLILFYSTHFMNTIKKINVKFFSARYNCWTLFIGQGAFLNATLFRLKPVNIPKNEFWADPFLFEYKNDNYVFFENYEYDTRKGKISCGIINGSDLINIVDVMDFDYHLSYPFIFRDGDDIFLMPETHENKRLEIYKCIMFPNKWELYSSAFEGEVVHDASFYVDESGCRWLFINKQAHTKSSDCSELFIYKVDNFKLDGLTPHKDNPVLIGDDIARNGGGIFNYNGSIYRPSQANVDGVYGKALNINKIEKLSIDEYVESTVLIAKPNFYKGLKAMHHLHQMEGRFVIDAAYEKI